MKYIDTHGHLNSKEFRNDISKYINNAKIAGVNKIIIPGTDKDDSYESISIAKEHDNVFAMVALHPSNGYKVSQIDWLENIDPSDLVGIGETGIDLYWKDNPPLEIQEEIFRRHLRYAVKHNLPVAVHTRDAEKETLSILKEKEFSNVKFIIHCSTMNKKWVNEFVKIGGYISFSGIVTFKNAVDVYEAMLSVPLDKLLTETDSPYLAPVPKRGKINYPEYVVYTSDFVAEHRSEEREKVLEQIYKNAHRIFSI